MMYIKELYVHPVKSMRGLQVQEARFSPQGLEGDRRFSVVLARNGVALTAREKPALLGIEAVVCDDNLLLAYQGKKISVSLSARGQSQNYRIWGDQISAQDLGDAVANYLSSIVGKEVRLVETTEDSRRQSPLVNVPHNFVDLMPLLMTSDASLEALNSHLDNPISQRHFRPNIVIGGVEKAYAEDTWDQVQIGGNTFEITFGCSRCIMPEYDPETQLKDKALPVTQALRSTRQAIDKLLYFGQNAMPLTTGDVQVGDPVKILTTRNNQRLNADGKTFYTPE
ncbi:MOSC domain-containing protein [Temperatibacter marinus]|uniref:MOSC domain-containing protein n=1 Tax=Temperatibacter marinus TaxID=1456591 RepID=A0AA52EK20_9PROT|nr:MOSC N-terminal beta barrel domain-containing protein [Temperatibacter marinus]WND03919.1 MOSC domain-containing protein [Temperatibacter marinus]